MSALAEALVAAQRRAISALEKAHVAGLIDGETLAARLTEIGCADAVDQAQLLAALDTLREYGATLPAEPKPNGTPAAERKATPGQVSFARDLLKRGNFEPIPQTDLEAMTFEQASKLIDALKQGSYDPNEWQVPF